jgi:hypothetical protein
MPHTHHPSAFAWLLPVVPVGPFLCGPGPDRLGSRHVAALATQPPTHLPTYPPTRTRPPAPAHPPVCRARTPGLPNVEDHDDIPKAVNQQDGSCVAVTTSTQTGWAPWAAAQYYDTRGVDFEDLQPIPGECAVRQCSSLAHLLAVCKHAVWLQALEVAQQYWAHSNGHSNLASGAFSTFPHLPQAPTTASDPRSTRPPCSSSTATLAAPARAGRWWPATYPRAAHIRPLTASRSAAALPA